MKTQIRSLRNVMVFALLSVFVFGQDLLAQDEPMYFEITKLKSGEDFWNVQQEIVKPFIQERIKRGNLRAWVLYQVMYPNVEEAAYDYVAMSVFDHFDHVNLSDEKVGAMAATVWPGFDINTLYQRFDKAAENVGSEIFMIRGEAVPGGPEKGAARQYVQVNHMKVAEGNSSAYVKMENDIFKPIHQKRAENGTMAEWLLFQRVMPRGTDWDNNFITMDFYTNWNDIMNWDGELFQQVHPDINADQTWSKMSSLRELTRSETWKIVMTVNQPAEAVTYETIEEGSGDSPMRGHEVTYRGTIMNAAGETIVSSDILGFDFYHTIGSDPNARHFDKGLLNMKKGGVAKIMMPASAQDANMQNMLGGKDAIVKVEMVNFGEAKPDGAAMLKRKIMAHGLSTAKAKYQKLQSDNSKGYVFREDKMNMLGYQLLGEGKTHEAIWVFELNTRNYPKSWNACDSLADAYHAAGNHPKAKHCYQMALKINPDFKAAKDKLAEL
ncbi:MAG: hypothetical protein AAFZ15_18705 [Bacteroidota bacterium]